MNFGLLDTVSSSISLGCKVYIRAGRNTSDQRRDQLGMCWWRDAILYGWYAAGADFHSSQFFKIQIADSLVIFLLQTSHSHTLAS